MKKTLLMAITALITGIAQGQVTNGLVAKYSFNSGNANDEVGTNHGTVNGAALTTDRFGNPNKAYNFINGDNITLPNASVLKSANMTISLWVKVDSFCTSNVSTNYIYSIVNSTTAAYFATLCLSVYTSDGKYLSVTQNGPSQSTLGFSANTSGSTWQHYVIAIDNDSMRMYIGGQKEWSIYKGFALNYTSDLIYIGQSGNTTYPGNLNGSVDDIRVYNRVLNAAEVNDLFNEPNPVVNLNAGLVAKYSFNGGNANDEIGSNNGTVTGASLTTDRFGNTNKAYAFDGVDDHIDMGDVAPFRMGNNDFSISIWVNYSINQQANIISKRAGGSANFNMYTLSVTNDPQFGGASPNIWAFLRSSNSNDRDILAGNLLGAWHHIVLIHKYANSTSVFVDGQFAGSDAATVSGVYDITGHPLVLGYASESNSNFYKGSMDDIRIYNRALSAPEIASLFNDPNPVVNLNAGLVAKYSFNGGNANDEIGSNNGTVTGASLTTDRFGNANKAYTFDGINDKIDFGDAPAFRMGNNNFTISAWAKFNTAQFAPLLNKRKDSPSFDQYSINVGQFGAADNTIGFYYKPSPGGVGAPDRGFSGNTMDALWHHVTVVNTFGGSTSLFIDGQFTGSSSTSFTTGDFNITGANLVAGFTNVLGTDYYYKGDLDDIRIYSRALSTLEIDSLFKEANPVGTTIREIAQKNIITLYPNPAKGQVTLSNNCNITVTDVTGKVVLAQENTSSIDLTTQPAGIYFITLTNTKGELLQRSKLIKE